MVPFSNGFSADNSCVELAKDCMLHVGTLSTGSRMKKTQINTPSLQEKAYLYLRGKILSGELGPGSAVSEVSIARELGNSRGPLREAIRRLTAEGFLQPAPAGG